jgi:hypothetical protein
MNKPILAASTGVAFGLFLGGLFFLAPRVHSCHRHTVTITRTEMFGSKAQTPYWPCSHSHRAEPVAQAPAVSEAASPDALIIAAQHAYVTGDYKNAIAIAQKAEPESPTRAWRIIGASACSTHDIQLISESFQHLDAAARQYVVYVCERNGVERDSKGFRLVAAQ